MPELRFWIITEIEHDNLIELRKLLGAYQKPLAIISGARIIKREIVELFTGGIVNFHPGKIPETSGLDSFFYSIKNNVPVGVTVHFINHLIDAGEKIDFFELPLTQDDTPEDVTNNLYYLQIHALRKFIQRMQSGCLSTTKLIRPKKNMPMDDNQKNEALKKFNAWKDRVIRQQDGEKLLLACALGDLKEITYYLSKDEDLIEYKNNKGWTPLIVAAFNQRLFAVKLLLSSGADPNASNINGTTVMMYKNQTIK